MNPKGRPRIDPKGQKRTQRTLYATDSEWLVITRTLDSLRLNKPIRDNTSIKQPSAAVQTTYSPQEDDFTDQSSDDEFIG